MILEDKILYFKIDNVLIFKTLTETLNSLISDVNWNFIKDKDEDPRLEIATTDSSKTIYFKSKFNKNIFKSFHCTENNYKIGINLDIFNKILKLIDKDINTVYFYILENDKDNLIIKIKGKDKKKTTYNMKLIELDEDHRKNNEIKFDKKIDIPGDEFHKLCKEMSIFADYLSINCSTKNIKFSCEGISTKRNTVYKNGEDNIEIINNNNQDVKGMYEIKNIQLFSKCINLSKDFAIYMKQNFALVAIYTIEDIGNISVAFSPIQEEDLNNILYSYSDDEDEIDLISNNNNKLLEDDD